MADYFFCCFSMYNVHEQYHKRLSHLITVSHRFLLRTQRSSDNLDFLGAYQLVLSYSYQWLSTRTFLTVGKWLVGAWLPPFSCWITFWRINIITNAFISKIIQYNYILHEGDPSDIRILQDMALIFTAFKQHMWQWPPSCYSGFENQIPRYTRKIHVSQRIVWYPWNEIDQFKPLIMEELQ